MKMPKDGSWAWRNILDTGATTLKFIRYQIADGQDTNLWTDPWCEGSLLVDNEQARREIIFPTTAKVSSLILDGQWNDHVRRLNPGPLKSAILNIEINSLLTQDLLIWAPNSNGIFTTKSAYDSIRPKWPHVRWGGLVWGKWTILRHSFVAW